MPLDPSNYSGTYKPIAGSPALDFANLVSYRDTDREHDWLVPASNLAVWSDALGLNGRVRTGTQPLRELRELLARVFAAIADGERPAPDDLDELSRLARRECAHGLLTFEPDDVAATWEQPQATLADQIVADAIKLLTSQEAMSRLTACAECRWVFLDMSRNLSRRWCDPADCGNRARQRRYYQRQRPQ